MWQSLFLIFKIVDWVIHLLDSGLAWSGKQRRNRIFFRAAITAFSLWLVDWQAQILNCVPPRTKYNPFSFLRLKRKGPWRSKLYLNNNGLQYNAATFTHITYLSRQKQTSAKILCCECFLEKELKFSIHEEKQSKWKTPSFFTFPKKQNRHFLISSCPWDIRGTLPL